MRIAEQFGIVYLLLNVAQGQKLIEKQREAAGVDIKVEFLKLSGGSAVNDALLSGNVEIAGAGVGPLFTLWDRTKGKQKVKGVAAQDAGWNVLGYTTQAHAFSGASSGKGGLGWFIFQNRNGLYTDRVFAGLAQVIIIGLLVESLGLDTLERLKVWRWGVQR